MAMPRWDGGTSLTTSPSIFSSPGDVLQPGDLPEQRRLPAAGRADEDDELARLDVEVDAVKDVQAAIGLLDLPEREICHGLLPKVLLFLCRFLGAVRLAARTRLRNLVVNHTALRSSGKPVTA